MTNRSTSKILPVFLSALSAASTALPARAIPPTLPGLPPLLNVTAAKNALLIDTIKANDGLNVKIYRHKVSAATGNPEAWTYVTDGLVKLGQAEIVLTVLKRSTEDDRDFPELPIKLFDSISQLAAQHKVVSVGGYTEFRTTGFLGHQFRALLYAPVPEILGVPVPSEAIAMVPITEDEMLVYQLAGATRLMARLGKQGRYFPCPTWCDRDRTSSTSPAELTEMQEDPVFKSAKAQTYSLSAIQEKLALSLRVTEKSAALLSGLLNELPPDSALRMALGLDPRADALLVWESTANGTNTIIAPEGSKCKAIGLTFIALLPGLSKSEILNGNDGCAIMLTKEDFSRFKEALSGKKEFSVVMPETSALKSFSLFWSADQ